MFDEPINRFIKSIEEEKLVDLTWMTHEAVLELIPNCRVATKWRVPFYIYHKNLCYLNHRKNHLYLGFMQGQLMNDHVLLDKSGTLTIAKYYIHTELDVRENSFFEILLDAVALQDNMHSKT